MVDSDEIAEATREALGVDDDFGLPLGAWRNGQLDMAGALLLGQQRDEALLEVPCSCPLHQLRRGSRREHAPRVHGDDPVPLLGFVHVSGGDDDAHTGAARTDVIDQRPELAARQRIDARRRLVENEEVRLVHERAAEPDLLLHPARKLAGGAAGKGPETRGVEQLLDFAPGAPAAERPKSRAMKSTFSWTLSSK